MDKLNYLFLILFQAGVALLMFSPRWDLKARAEYYYGKGKEKIQKSHFSSFIDSIKRSGKADILQREMSEGLAYIKNIVVLGRGSSVSSELLLTELADISRELSPVYLEMASHMHMNEKDSASKLLEDAVPGSLTPDIARLLTGWEEIDPDSLLSTVELYQTSLREERSTKQLKKDELISDLIYFQVVANCMVVLLNFIYVGYFIEQREALRFLF